MVNDDDDELVQFENSFPRHIDNPYTANPSEQTASWLKENPETITAWHPKQVPMPISWLMNVPGRRDEHKRINMENPRVQDIAKSIKDNGYDKSKPISLEYDMHGNPWIYEGNHRIRASHVAGLDFIPTEVKYLGGGEQFSHAFDAHKWHEKQKTLKTSGGAKRMANKDVKVNDFKNGEDKEWLKQHPGRKTGSITSPIELPVEWLVKLPGLRGEDEKLTFNMSKIKGMAEHCVTDKGWRDDHPMTLEVHHNGEIYIFDGSHRCRAAKLAKLKTYPCRIDFYGGAEAKFNVNKIMKKDAALPEFQPAMSDELAELIKTPNFVNPNYGKFTDTDKLPILHPMSPKQTPNGDELSIINPMSPVNEQKYNTYDPGNPDYDVSRIAPTDSFLSLTNPKKNKLISENNLNVNSSYPYVGDKTKCKITGCNQHREGVGQFCEKHYPFNQTNPQSTKPDDIQKAAFQIAYHILKKFADDQGIAGATDVDGSPGDQNYAAMHDQGVDYAGANDPDKGDQHSLTKDDEPLPEQDSRVTTGELIDYITQLASEDDKFTDKKGLCYENAGRHLRDSEHGGKLVHGSVMSNGKRLNHAWVNEGETLGIYEPEHSKHHSQEDFNEWFKPQVHNEYDVDEMRKNLGKQKNWGPWEDNDDIKLKAKLSHNKFTDKEHRQHDHIKKSEEENGMSSKEADEVAWKTVNKQKHEGNLVNVGVALAALILLSDYKGISTYDDPHDAPHIPPSLEMESPEPEHVFHMLQPATVNGITPPAHNRFVEIPMTDSSRFSLNEKIIKLITKVSAEIPKYEQIGDMYVAPATSKSLHTKVKLPDADNNTHEIGNTDTVIDTNPKTYNNGYTNSVFDKSKPYLDQGMRSQYKDELPEEVHDRFLPFNYNHQNVIDPKYNQIINMNYAINLAKKILASSNKPCQECGAPTDSCMCRDNTNISPGYTLDGKQRKNNPVKTKSTMPKEMNPGIGQQKL